MPRIEESSSSLPRLIAGNVEAWARDTSISLPAFIARLVRQLNNLADGRIEAANSAGTAAPTGGTWAVGDFVRHSAPSEAGSAGSKYVVIGWICTAAGTPGTWLECRCLTGN